MAPISNPTSFSGVRLATSALAISVFGKAPRMAKTFLITGVSSGFGRALAEAALRDGHTVAGTVRKEGDRADFEKLGALSNVHGVILDVTGTARIGPVVADIEN